MIKISPISVLVTFLTVLDVSNSFATSRSNTSSRFEVEWDDRIMIIQRNYLNALEAYKIRDYKSAFLIWMPMAEQGFSYAQADIAGLFFNGWGVKKDLKKAFIWYKKAALNKNTYAQYMMGNLYWNGHGVPVQTDIAQVWWKMAADKGYKDAQFSLPYQYCYIKHPMC